MLIRCPVAELSGAVAGDTVSDVVDCTTDAVDDVIGTVDNTITQIIIFCCAVTILVHGAVVGAIGCTVVGTVRRAIAGAVCVAVRSTVCCAVARACAIAGTGWTGTAGSRVICSVIAGIISAGCEQGQRKADQ